MTTFTTAYFASVLFGIVILVGYSLRRFEEHAAGVPDVFRMIRLTPRLMSRPDRFRRGLALYIGTTLLVFVLITLAPQHFLAIIQSLGGQGSGGEATKELVAGLTERTGAALPLAVALLMTSNAFVRFANGPELFLRRLCQKVAGIPDELAFVTAVLRRTREPDAERTARLCEELELPSIGADAFWKGSRSPEIKRVWKRTLAIAHALTRLQQASSAPDISVDVPELDPRVFENFWRLAEPRITELRTVTKRIQADHFVRSHPELVEIEHQRIQSWDVMRERIDTLHEELSALLAAALATSGMTDLTQPMMQLRLIGGESDPAAMFIRRSARIRRRTSEMVKKLVLLTVVAGAGVAAIGLSLRHAGRFLPPDWVAAVPDLLGSEDTGRVPSIGMLVLPSAQHALLFVVTIVLVLGAAVMSAWMRRERMLSAGAYIATDDRPNVSAATYFELALAAGTAALLVVSILNLLPLLGFGAVIIEHLEAAREFAKGCSQWHIDMDAGGDSGTALIFLLGAVSFLFAVLLAPITITVVLLAVTDHADDRVSRTDRLPVAGAVVGLALAALSPVLASRIASDILGSTFERAVGEVRLTMTPESRERFQQSYRMAIEALGRRPDPVVAPLWNQTTVPRRDPTQPPGPLDTVKGGEGSDSLLSWLNDVKKHGKEDRQLDPRKLNQAMVVGYCHSDVDAAHKVQLRQDAQVRLVGAPLLQAEPCSCAIVAQEISKGWLGQTQYAWFADKPIFPAGQEGGIPMPRYKRQKQVDPDEERIARRIAERQEAANTIRTALTSLVYLATALLLWRMLRRWQRDDIANPIDDRPRPGEQGVAA